MALTIKNIPVLESATAKEFVRSAEEFPYTTDCVMLAYNKKPLNI